MKWGVAGQEKKMRQGISPGVGSRIGATPRSLRQQHSANAPALPRQATAEMEPLNSNAAASAGRQRERENGNEEEEGGEKEKKERERRNEREGGNERRTPPHTKRGGKTCQAPANHRHAQ